MITTGARLYRIIGVAIGVALCTTTVYPQSPVEFDVVSIKKNTTGQMGGGARTLPDGTAVITNQPIRSIFGRATTEPFRDIEGLPGWAMDRYDITAKPPEGATREQQAQMWRALLADRFKFASHMEHRERDGFELVLARSDRRLGPKLKPSTLDCMPKPGTPPPPPPQGPIKPEDFLNRCGMLVSFDRYVSGGTPIGNLAPTLSSLVGAPVDDGTGLTGFYALDLKFARPRPAAGPSPDTPQLDDAPDIFTALQEQLGLKLQRRKITIGVLVIDHVEPPTEN